MSNPGRVAWAGWFSLDVPLGWAVSEDSGVISLFDARDGVGAIQISLARTMRSSPVESDEANDLAIEFARQRGWPLDINCIKQDTCDGWPASSFEFLDAEDDPTVGKVWHVLDRTRVALFTYNCAPDQKGVEQSEVANVVASIRWLPPL